MNAYETLRDALYDRELAIKIQRGGDVAVPLPNRIEVAPETRKQILASLPPWVAAIPYPDVPETFMGTPLVVNRLAEIGIATVIEPDGRRTEVAL